MTNPECLPAEARGNEGQEKQEEQEGAVDGRLAESPEPTYNTNDDQARLLYVRQLQEIVVRNGNYWEEEVKQISRTRSTVFRGGVVAIILGIACVVIGIVLMFRNAQVYGVFLTSVGALISVGLAPLYRFERRLAEEKKIAMRSIEHQTNIMQVTGIAVMTSPEQRERILGDLAAKLMGLIGEYRDR